jgi:hypothetical protein
LPYLLVGGIASGIMGRPRWTHDLDFFVRPQDARPMLRDQLIHDPRLHEQHLTVRVEETRVTVGGRVSTPERQQAVSLVAREIMPGKEITNATVVVAQDEPEPGADERMA